MTYLDKLKDPRWQKRRLKVMEYAHWRCQICGTKDNTLHCHHSYYTKGKEPWQYPDGSIICICDKCHRIIHPEREFPKAEEYGPTVPIAEGKLSFAKIRKLLEGVNNGG